MMVPTNPPALKGTRGKSQIKYCGERTLEPSMNASISAAMPRKCPDPEPAAPAKLPPHREPRNGQQQKGEQRAEGGRKTYALAPKLESAVLEDDAVHRAEEHQDRRRDALHLQSALRLVGEALQKPMATEEGEGQEGVRDHGRKTAHPRMAPRRVSASGRIARAG